MNLTIFTLGVLLLTIAIVDLVWTTLWVEGGAGPLTSRLMSWSWRILRKMLDQNSQWLSLKGAAGFCNQSLGVDFSSLGRVDTHLCQC